MAAARGASRRPLALPAAAAAILILLLLAANLPRAGDDPSAPALTNQDVVRMVASGMPEERILRRIREVAGDYDVSADMIEELRLAGVPGAIIGEMKAKAAAGGRAKAGVEPQGPRPTPKGFLEIDFMDDPSGSPAENSASAPAVAEIREPKLTGPVDLAFVVACTHPAHVPDQWDAVSPLDPRTGRHQILFFQPATAPAAESRKEKGLVYLKHPASWRLEAEAAEHRGFIGVAARIGTEGKYVPIVDADFDRIEIREGLVTHVQVRLHSTLHGGSKRDPSHPVTSDPTMTNIGSTATRGWEMRNTIMILKVEAPRSE